MTCGRSHSYCVAGQEFEPKVLTLNGFSRNWKDLPGLNRAAQASTQCSHDVNGKKEGESPLGRVDGGHLQQLVLGQLDLGAEPRPAWAAHVREIASLFQPLMFHPLEEQDPCPPPNPVHTCCRWGLWSRICTGRRKGSAGAGLPVFRSCHLQAA